MKLRKIRPGYYEIIEREKPKRPAAPRPPSQRQLITMYAQRTWRRHGDMFGDWAVAGMTEAERERFIGGGDRRLDKQANDCMEEGLRDAMACDGVPLRLFDKVCRAVKRLAHLD